MIIENKKLLAPAIIENTQPIKANKPVNAFKKRCLKVIIYTFLITIDIR